MFVVLGASGHTGHIVANTLLTRGQQVRVLGRNSAKLQPLASKGAEVFIADLADAAAVTKAFQQCDSAYVMIPPNLTSKDPLGSSDRVSDAIAAAVQKSGVKNLVVLSSIGAELPSGTGPVVGLHRLEQKLNQIGHANALYLRAAYFMENTLPQVGAIKSLGHAAGPLRPDLKIPMVATRDIGNVAADSLLHPTMRGKQIRELHGQRDLSYPDVAAILGKSIGKPDLEYVQMPNDQFRKVLVETGMSQPVADLLAEMTNALNAGKMRAIEPRTSQNTTPTTYETFVADSFIPAYQEQIAA